MIRYSIMRVWLLSVMFVLGILIPTNYSTAHTLSPKAVSYFTAEKPIIQTDATSSQATNTDPRNYSRTLSTFPEWYIVYSAQEYSDFTARGGRPSQFPYFAAIQQYWDALDAIKISLDGTEIDPESLSVLQVIGISFTIEYGIIGAYEKTIGLAFELLNFNKKTTEDYTTDSIAEQYSDSLLQTPWYDFSYHQAVGTLWKSWGWSSLSPRGLERRIIFTLGYHLKGAYASLLGKVAEANFGYVGYTTSIITQNIDTATLASIPAITSVEATTTGVTALAPRYRAFTDTVKQVVAAGGTIIDIQGNSEILLSFVTAQNNSCALPGQTIFSLPVLTNTKEARIGQLISVTELDLTLKQLSDCNIAVEHIYDY